MMRSLKAWLKGHLPHGAVDQFLPAYHLVRAVLANLLYGFPARKMKVIAITGTNGKTTTASFIANILKSAGYQVGVSTTAFFEVNGKRLINDTNMTVTDPFKLQKILHRMQRRGTEWVVLEVTSHALSQNRIWGIPIKAAVITNLTQDHLDYHGSMENYAAAKAKLLDLKPESVILNRDDEWFEYFDQHARAEHKISYGTHDQADARIVNAKLKPSGSEFKLAIDKNLTSELEIQLVGKFNVYNAVAAFSTAYVLHIDFDAISRGLADLQAVPGRMESIKEGQPFDVIVDYAHTPDALSNLLETLRALTTNRLILVFGATGDRDRTKRPIMGEIAAKMTNRVFVTDEEPYGENPAKIREAVMKGIAKGGGSGHAKEVANRREAIAEALKIARAGDTVVVTGMGHQKYMTIGNKKYPWDDREVVRELLKQK